MFGSVIPICFIIIEKQYSTPKLWLQQRFSFRIVELFSKCYIHAVLMTLIQSSRLMAEEREADGFVAAFGGGLPLRQFL